MEKLKKMNDFEKCLLIQELVRHGQMEKAKAIANAMLLTQKSKKTPFK